eukprot:TRINITY_DN3383_c0_g1_i15.p2 TRINITY_DN3383_c0_g1~~TRINITY_DN3383_c0_g1_i15.p2  ORF type:complete len:182 (+),score=44.99 TRINITY_DN3383_c0_g1_i15:906-1451(+)
MSRPVKDREIRVFRLNQSQSNLRSALQVFEEEYNATEEEQIYRDELVKIVKELEQSQQFSSRRKKEFEDLARRPVFSETRIRIKFPDSIVVEAKFSPLETLETLIPFVRDLLADPGLDFFLFQTPPVQKIAGALAKKTFDESDSVPSGVYYVGLNNKDQEKELILTSGFLKPSLLSNLINV